MIYEVRTYQIAPRSLPEVLHRFGEAYEHRKSFSEMSAFWYTEIGPLNQIIHVWPYENAGERERIRAEAGATPHWPPPIGEFLVTMNSEIFTPAPFCPEFKTGENGPIYEMRSYTLKAGKIPGMIEGWAPKIEERSKRSPLTIAMYTEVGDLNKWVHVWSYESLSQRSEVRDKAKADGIWPPGGGGDRLVYQENKILLPAPFSPAR